MSLGYEQIVEGAANGAASVVCDGNEQAMRDGCQLTRPYCYAARLNRGAASLSGGTAITSILVVVSLVRQQLGQWNRCPIVSASTKVDRVHFMSIRQFGQVGGSNSSNARLILSTALPHLGCFPLYDTAKFKLGQGLKSGPARLATKSPAQGRADRKYR